MQSPITLVNENDAMWLGSDGIWRFKKPHVTKEISNDSHLLAPYQPSSPCSHIPQTPLDSQDTQSDRVEELLDGPTHQVP
jgi:hypothetical protein